MSNIKVTQEVEVEIGLDELLEQADASDLLAGLEENIGLDEILDHFDYATVLDTMKNARGLDSLLDNFSTRTIVMELVETHGVQKMQDLLNEHHESARYYASLEQKLEGVSLEDLTKHLIKKYSASTLLSTFAIAIEEKKEV